MFRVVFFLYMRCELVRHTFRGEINCSYKTNVESCTSVAPLTKRDQSWRLSLPLNFIKYMMACSCNEMYSNRKFYYNIYSKLTLISPHANPVRSVRLVGKFHDRKPPSDGNCPKNSLVVTHFPN